MVPFSRGNVVKAKILIEKPIEYVCEAVNSSSECNTLPWTAPAGNARALTLPSYLTDPVAVEEWERVAPALLQRGVLSEMMRTYLAGYCNALSRAVRAEKITEQEGRYYRTRTSRGSLLKRRHPASKDAQDSWALVMQFAKHIDRVVLKGGNCSANNTRSSPFK